MARSQEQGEEVIVTDKQPSEVAQVDQPDGANIIDGVAHACSIRADGYEVCLGCGHDWPCTHAQQLAVQAVELVRAPEPADVVAQSVSTGLPWPLVADQLGVDRAAVQAFIDAGTDAGP